MGHWNDYASAGAALQEGTVLADKQPVHFAGRTAGHLAGFAAIFSGHFRNFRFGKPDCGAAGQHDYVRLVFGAVFIRDMAGFGHGVCQTHQRHCFAFNLLYRLDGADSLCAMQDAALAAFGYIAVFDKPVLPVSLVFMESKGQVDGCNCLLGGCAWVGAALK